jgi:dihydroorotate dehydrogenase
MLDLYPLLRPLLFRLSPETAMRVSMQLLRMAPACCCPQIPNHPIELMGLSFKNPLGIAAGVDDNGDYVDILAKLGVGFIEVGGVTPRPQPGNPRPRIFRLAKHRSLINRKGFANKGVDYCVEKLKSRRYRGIVGVNISKMKDTPLAEAVFDYEVCYRKCHPEADFVTLNISSPNTPQLRQLQTQAYLEALLSTLKRVQRDCELATGRYVPLTVKLAPDLEYPELAEITKALLNTGIDGVICSNTTLTRDTVGDSPLAAQTGGLSGAGLTLRARHVLTDLAELLRDRIPIIAVGGICDAAEANRRIEAGASLIQVYTGLVYRGPQLLEEIGQVLCG